MQVLSFIEEEGNNVKEITKFIYPTCSHNVVVKCRNWYSVYYVKKYFSWNRTFFACAFFVKKNKTKQLNKKSFNLFKWFSLIITSISFNNFIQWATASVCDHSLWNLGVTKSTKMAEQKKRLDHNFKYSFIRLS